MVNDKSRSRPVGHVPANKSQIGMRKPPRTSIRVLRQFVVLMDKDPRSYDVIAERAGITKQTLSYWRHGNRTPSAQTLEDVLQVLGYRLLMIPDATEQIVPSPGAVPLIDTVPDSIMVNGVEYIRASSIKTITLAKE
jgi:transcriptional regulator with XRE-family HTH domain